MHCASSDSIQHAKLFQHLIAQNRLAFESALGEEGAMRATAPATHVTQNTQKVLYGDESEGGDDESKIVENVPKTADI